VTASPDPSSAAAPADMAAAVDRYVAFMQGLGPDALDRLDEGLTEDARFCDPFNDVTGLPAVRRVFAHTYRMLRDVEIEVTDRAITGDRCYLRWVFHYRMARSPRRWSVVGVSELHFAPDGRVSAHIDHWDAAGQIYEKLPVLGPILRRIRRRLQP